MEEKKKRRAIANSGPSINQIHRGPERTDQKKAVADRDLLEAEYGSATIIVKGEPLYYGDTCTHVTFED